MIRLTIALATLGTALALARPAEAQRRSDTFNWEGRVPSGKWIYLRNVNGEVRVERGTGDKVQVTATKRWRRGNPDDVRITTEKADDGESVVVCALYNPDATCDENGYSSRGRRHYSGNDDNDVNVEFVVRVPAGVRVDASTTNGDLSVTGATSEVIAHTTNGDVRAESTGGPVNASTTNGNVTASMRDLGSSRDLDFSTTNGSVIVEVPASLGAEIDMSTTNGHVASDFPMTLSGRIDPRRLHATIGDGSRRLRLHSTNGNVELRKVP
ncbi:protein of unknown function DUF4098 [Gemmatirosa kalamazoonensis]|uniref:DUF4097 domain-containing protein n=1 Tax=Gemmatirosa kalamazoonensis TaxID=861299 RepID=W0RNK6_9BACT|nr:DUF4097 family beta strand repeat-containing protein [Gemmatirosa kalamazoonensis]AHG91915.1 protein of unknown function DUF4098 [Gemmatirosa kalamazoonensis]